MILPDNDQSGQQHAEQIARSLIGVSREIKIIHLPGLPEKGPDWIAGREEEDGKALEEIRAALQFLAGHRLTAAFAVAECCSIVLS